MTNHELARAAAESCCGSIFIGFGLFEFDTPGKQKTVEDVIARKVADTYAEPLAELERLRFALVKVIGHTGHLRTVNTSTEQLLDGLLKNIARIAKEALKDCPHSEVAK